MNLNNAIAVLVIEDNPAIQANIADYFTMQGAITDFALRGRQGAALALQNYYDVVILDLTLPQLDGLDVCTLLRQKANRHIPVLMLTARDSLQNKLAGFSAGADDYLVKPFDLAELWARVQVLAGRRLQQPYQLALGNIRLNKQLHQVVCNAEVMQLKPITFLLLSILLEAYPRPVTRSELSSKIWHDEPTESDALRSHLYQLRKTLQKHGASVTIETLHGVGFMLKAEPTG
ncbi:DNA-binding response OmpR family regulator [Rheinheimera pacifica]|uniref:response regulator transcription factor n=1 Tax=Rheinheimera pacifica TaxID=173990 RepID=UPI002866048D|nr:response regulator transcription factor [Rheinheimera pacifica]MDR6981847.1 DNA-binding response OmpR family regulator [Rheinheimera pacifica]